MADVAVIQYQTRPEAAEENERLVAQVFAELAAEQPEGLRYASLRLADGVSFVHVVVSEAGSDALPQLAAFQEFARGLGDRVTGPPARSTADIVGSYGFLNA